MRKIKIKNMFTIVDDENFDLLNQWRWDLTNGYAVRKDKNKSIRMHRIINNTPKGMETDHINRNRLDNRKCNLRTVTRSQNMTNVGLTISNTSGYKGVYWNKGRKKWEAQITNNSKTTYLGLYSNLQIALLARKLGEKTYWSESFCMNLPEQTATKVETTKGEDIPY